MRREPDIDRKIFISIIILVILILAALALAAFDFMGTAYRSRLLNDYKQKANSSLSDSEFIEELVEQNQEFREQIDSLKLELAENELVIQRLVDRHNLSFNQSYNAGHINRDNIQIYDDRIVIYIKDAFGAVFADSRSMYPFINKNVFGIEVVPDSEDDIAAGDIIGFWSDEYNTSIIHRVVEVGVDEKGWFAITQGDNNPFPDPNKVRFEDVIGVLVGLVY